jgi:hypothetical protein
MYNIPFILTRWQKPLSKLRTVTFWLSASKAALRLSRRYAGNGVFLVGQDPCGPAYSLLWKRLYQIIGGSTGLPLYIFANQNKSY